MNELTPVSTFFRLEQDPKLILCLFVELEIREGSRLAEHLEGGGLLCVQVGAFLIPPRSWLSFANCRAGNFLRLGLNRGVDYQASKEAILFFGRKLICRLNRS